jgi:hypothetical protein
VARGQGEGGGRGRVLRVCSLSLSLSASLHIRYTRGAICADQGDGVCMVCSGRRRDLDDVRVQGDEGAVAQQPGRDGGEGVGLHAERGRRASSEVGKTLGSEVGVGPALGLG